MIVSRENGDNVEAVSHLEKGAEARLIGILDRIKRKCEKRIQCLGVYNLGTSNGLG